MKRIFDGLFLTSLLGGCDAVSQPDYLAKALEDLGHLRSFLRQRDDTTSETAQTIGLQLRESQAEVERLGIDDQKDRLEAKNLAVENERLKREVKSWQDKAEQYKDEVRSTETEKEKYEDALDKIKDFNAMAYSALEGTAGGKKRLPLLALKKGDGVAPAADADGVPAGMSTSPEAVAAVGKATAGAGRHPLVPVVAPMSATTGTEGEDDAASTTPAGGLSTPATTPADSTATAGDDAAGEGDDATAATAVENKPTTTAAVAKVATSLQSAACKGPGCGGDKPADGPAPVADPATAGDDAGAADSTDDLNAMASQLGIDIS